MDWAAWTVPLFFGLLTLSVFLRRHRSDTVSFLSISCPFINRAANFLYMKTTTLHTLRPMLAQMHKLQQKETSTIRILYQNHTRHEYY